MPVGRYLQTPPGSATKPSLQRALLLLGGVSTDLIDEAVSQAPTNPVELAQLEQAAEVDVQR